MKTQQLLLMGIPVGPPVEAARQALRSAAAGGLGVQARKQRLADVVQDPSSHRTDPYFGRLAGLLADSPPVEAAGSSAR
jgi:hypothetical protein